MMQFLKWILFGNTTNNHKELAQDLVKCHVRIDQLEKQNQQLTQSIDELSSCVSTVATATQVLAQDISSIATVITESSKKKLADPFRLFGNDDDDDGYLH